LQICCNFVAKSILKSSKALNLLDYSMIVATQLSTIFALFFPLFSVDFIAFSAPFPCRVSVCMIF